MAKKKKEIGFSFEFPNATVLKAVAEVMAKVCSEMVFITDSESITLQGMDEGHIGIAIWTIQKDKLVSFYNEGDHFIGISAQDLDKIFKRIKPEENIKMHFSEIEQKFKIVAQVPDTKKKRTFRLMVLDIEIADPEDKESSQSGIPDLREGAFFTIEYDASFIPKTSDFVEAINDAEIYSEVINIIALFKEEMIQFESHGIAGNFICELGTDELIDYDIPQDVHTSYSSTMIKRVLKLTPITESLEINLKKDYPLKLDFEIIGGYNIYYFLGARVEEEDEGESMEDEF